MAGVRRENLAWAAGFADGECSFYLEKNSPRYPRTPCFTITQIDARVLHRFRDVVGFGVVMGPNGPYNKGPKARPLYYFRVRGFEKVQAVMALLWSWLGPVKRAQAQATLKGE